MPKKNPILEAHDYRIAKFTCRRLCCGDGISGQQVAAEATPLIEAIPNDDQNFGDFLSRQRT